jgi:gas vesicle protein
MEEYMNEREASGRSFVAGLITGVLAGAGVAFILAPQTGEETRDFLRSKVREAGEQAGGLYEKGKIVIENARGTIEANSEDERSGPEREPESEPIHL